MPQSQLKIGSPTFSLTSYPEEDVAHGWNRFGGETQRSLPKEARELGLELKIRFKLLRTQSSRVNPLRPIEWNHQRLSIPLASLSQQRRIATILTTLVEVIEATEKHQQIRAGLMHDFFTRLELARGDHKGLPCGATAQAGQLRPTPQEAPELYQDSPLGPILKV